MKTLLPYCSPPRRSQVNAGGMTHRRFGLDAIQTPSTYAFRDLKLENDLIPSNLLTCHMSI